MTQASVNHRPKVAMHGQKHQLRQDDNANQYEDVWELPNKREA
jgi:hypothetical protein